MIPAKICGITRFEDAQLAVELGAGAIGFVFYPKSPRYIEAGAAGCISEKLPPHVARIGVFVNPDLETLMITAKTAHLTHIQFHGEESASLCEHVPLPVIKTVRNATELEKYVHAPVAAFLIDSRTLNQFGGTGQLADWSFCRQVRETARVILAGGLSAGNVAEAVEIASPDAVDLSSSIESSPGVKDHQKLREFFAALEKVGAKSDWRSAVFLI
ncbi:MAG: phosphoribosylanthranilate isomerase [candidate division KSB1 bacterium]|nr:phosphoribosylanthranilate isomerase [candidate division KSB1 bacterium]MDZ7366358.1 phosphoribosylanthranilate isomerase [candidate division KSB1 bacterium]MDZ7404013.1 phosphoribosylanthranilate isomerase [candidate division KSB1 bacterium]